MSLSDFLTSNACRGTFQTSQMTNLLACSACISSHFKNNISTCMQQPTYVLYSFLQQNYYVANKPIAMYINSYYYLLGCY